MGSGLLPATSDSHCSSALSFGRRGKELGPDAAGLAHTAVADAGALEPEEALRGVASRQTRGTGSGQGAWVLLTHAAALPQTCDRSGLRARWARLPQTAVRSVNCTKVPRGGFQGTCPYPALQAEHPKKTTPSAVFFGLSLSRGTPFSSPPALG